MFANLTRKNERYCPVHEIRHFLEWGLSVVTYDDPFSASDLMEVAGVLGIPGNDEGQHKALLIDLRKVAVTGVSGDDSRNFVAARKVRMPDTPAEPAVFLIRGAEDYGHIRMHNIWSEALGFRNEEHTLITVDVEQAVSWLARMTNQPSLIDAMLPLLLR